MKDLTKEAKNLGRYYTPEKVAQIMCDWAIASSNPKIFDPSYGGCAFLRASINTLARSGVRQPGKLLYGVDIDPAARGFLYPLSRDGVKFHHFPQADFLKIQPADMVGSPYQVVIGNPPYVRHHRIQDKSHAQHYSKAGLSARASYWAYFLLHSLDFVAPNGRLAMILPGSFIHADYAENIRRQILKSFSSVVVVIVKERLFPEAEEMSVLLFCGGYGNQNDTLRIAMASSTEDIPEICTNPESKGAEIVFPTEKIHWISPLLNSGDFSVYEELIKDPLVSNLGSLGSIRIGTVTGCNETFVLSDQRRRELKISKTFVQPIVSRSIYLSGLSFKRSDYKNLVSQNKRTELLNVSKSSKLHAVLKGYFDKAEKVGVHRRFKCQARDPWYCIGRVEIPDAFLLYMSGEVPHIVLNDCGMTSTNAIHQVFWKTKLSRWQEQWLAICSLTTLFQLGAELCGRSYGGGVLKLEPREASKLPIVQPPKDKALITSNFTKIDRLLRNGNKSAARSLSDSLVLRNTLGILPKELDSLIAAYEFLKRLRTPFSVPSLPPAAR